MQFLGDDELERSAVVANCRMNRERDLTGSNGYDRDLGLNPLDELGRRASEGRSSAWLDLCCGSGKALIQAARIVHAEGWTWRSSGSIWRGCSDGSIPICIACGWSRHP